MAMSSRAWEIVEIIVDKKFVSANANDTVIFPWTAGTEETPNVLFSQPKLAVPEENLLARKYRKAYLFYQRRYFPAFRFSFKLFSP